MVTICFGLLSGGFSHARIIDFTLQEAVDTALANSYQIKRLELGIERTMYYLKAREASLKSRVSLNLRSPEMRLLSDYKWNSTLQRDEIVQENTLRWQSDLSVRQPIILFGYPTNGYLSLNNTLYQYNQKFIDDDDTSYYSRFFFRFDQPLLQANYLKNNYERAKLDLERYQLNYNNDRTWLIDRTSYTYYYLFELSYKNNIGATYIKNLEEVEKIVNRISENDSTRSIEKIQVQVELSNIREKLLENQSDLRLEMARVKQNLRINPEDSLAVKTDIEITPVTVDLEQAIHNGYNLRPTLRIHDIGKRRNEISLQEVKSQGAFHLDLSMTFGFEKQEDKYYGLWEDNDNSYSVSIRAYIPIWDWGRRKANISATKTYIKQSDLNIEESRNSIKSEITNSVENVEEYKQRAFNMLENMNVSKELSAASMIQFREGTISTQDILKTLERNMETELSFLDAYLGYKRSLIRLMVNTHYDYENRISVIDKFKKGI
ncbi:TolC family protein [Candidatus Latescibacterota bacterium]